MRVEHLDGEQRQQPTIERTLSGWRAAVGQVQHVVVEAVLLVPQAVAAAAHVHGVGDVEEVLEELGGDVLVDRVVRRQLERDLEHVLATCHPAVPSACSRCRRSAAARCGRRRRCCRGRGSRPRRRCGPRVLAVHPPGEVEQQLVEDALEEVEVALRRARPARSCRRARWPRRAPAGSRRRSSTRRPASGRWGACTTRAASAELLLGEVGVDERERHAVEGEVPGRVPGVLPLVGHRDDVARC
jgi:hypothetical protein